MTNIMWFCNATQKQILRDSRLAKMIQGEPQATETKTTEELKRLGFIGLYQKEQP